MPGRSRLRPVDTLVSPDVAETLRNLPDLTDADAAAVKLARLYAAAIDACDTPDALDKLGPKLLAALEALGATPRARASRKGGAVGGRTGGKLAAIRDARRPA